jgi:hypothetical protein
VATNVAIALVKSAFADTRAVRDELRGRLPDAHVTRIIGDDEANVVVTLADVSDLSEVRRGLIEPIEGIASVSWASVLIGTGSLRKPPTEWSPGYTSHIFIGQRVTESSDGANYLIDTLLNQRPDVLLSARLIGKYDGVVVLETNSSDFQALIESRTQLSENLATFGMEIAALKVCP